MAPGLVDGLALSGGALPFCFRIWRILPGAKTAIEACRGVSNYVYLLVGHWGGEGRGRVQVVTSCLFSSCFLSASMRGRFNLDYIDWDLGFGIWDLAWTGSLRLSSFDSGYIPLCYDVTLLFFPCSCRFAGMAGQSIGKKISSAMTS